MGNVIDFERARRDRELERITERLIEQADKQRRFREEYARRSYDHVSGVMVRYANREPQPGATEKPSGRMTWQFLSWQDVYYKPSLIDRVWHAVCCAIIDLRARLERRVNHLRS